MEASAEPQAARPVPAAGASRARNVLEGAAVFFVAACILRAVLINDDWPDFYLHLRQGERVASGEVPYRDFFLSVWPGTPCLLALWFKLAGTSMAGVRWLLAAAGGASVLLAWLIARRLIQGPLRWIAPFGALASYVLGSEGLGHLTFSPLLVLGAMLAALHADAAARKSLWFLAGALAALAGVFTQTLGAWTGLALLLVALSGPRGSRLRNTAATAMGACLVLGLMAGALAALGAWPAFVQDTLVWTVERYRPFHAGVGWGSWMPPWGELFSHLPGAWWFAWVPAMAVVWAGVYLFPLAALAGCARWLFDRDRQPARRILAFVCLAVLLSAFPHIGAMRVARLSAPVWILIAFEGHALFGGKPGAPAQRIVAGLACLALLCIAPLQWSYRSQRFEVDTPRGTVLLNAASRDELDVLRAAFPGGGEVLVLPEYGASGYLLGLKNPTRYETLIPVMYSPAQLREAAADLERRGFPPVVRMTARELSDPAAMRRVFNPAKFLDEFETDPLQAFLDAHYPPGRQAGPVILFRAKPKD
ncbi:MAG: hypothetical protein HY291_22725 [Planctomycetes bacterium]|nr:hypothetical protein [Planctomycetota bacterium]